MTIRQITNSVTFRYFVLSLFIMAPLLLPGFILTMDLVLTPRIPPPTDITNTFLLEGLLWLLGLFVPADAIEKGLLFAIFILSGIGAHRLFVGWSRVPEEYMKWGAYFAGIFYMINPFVYSRFMAGQWMVLLGYALLPFFIAALLKFLRWPTKRSSLLLALWLTAIASVSIHFIGIALMVFVVAVIFHCFRRRSYRILPLALLFAGVFLCVNLYWIVPASIGTLGESIHNFDSQHFEAFRTVSFGPLGPLAEAARLQGFWAEPLHLFTLPGDRVPAWGALFAVLWVIAGIGVRQGWKHAKTATTVVAVSALLAIILSTTSVIQMVASFLPLAAGYREPHKFVAVLALAFAFFGGIGVVRILKRWRDRPGSLQAVGVLVLFLPILITPTLLWGANSQLQSRHYPEGWQRVEEYLQTHRDADDKTIFLPWHQYLSFDFSQRIIATPATDYFTVPVIASIDPEFKDISPNVPSDMHYGVQEALASRSVTGLRAMGVRYVILSKSYDFKKYDWVWRNGEIVQRYDDAHVALYEIRRRE